MTRTLKLSALALVGAMILFACGGGNLGPKETGEKFLKALAEGDYGTAKDYATKGSQESLEMLEKMGGGEAGGSADDIVVGEVKEDGDKAMLAYTEKGAEKTLNLVKEDGSWKAEFNKGGDTGSSSNPIEDITDGIEEMATDIAEEVAEEMGE